MRQTYVKEYTRAHEIAALVAEVKRRQLQLDHKLAPLLLPIIEGILSGLSGAAIGYGFAKISDERLLQNAARWLKDYEADSRQGRAVYRETLERGGHTRELKFPAKHNGRERELLILTDNAARTQELVVSCWLRFIDWRGAVPTKRVISSERRMVNGGKLKIHPIHQGSERELALWLQNITPSAFAQARSDVGRYKSPSLYFEYHGARSGYDAPVNFEFKMT